MSSTYRVLCLSHDPAITVDEEFRNWDDATEAIEAKRIGHDQCDLVIGRYSYPLVEIACLGGRAEGRCNSYHTTFKREDPQWLLLMRESLAGDATSSAFGVAESISRRGCWSRQRLDRLRHELADAS